MSEYDCVGVTSEYLESLKNKITELEKQKAELVEFIKFMNEYGKLSPELLATKTDIIYHDSSDLLKKHGVEI